MVKSFKKELNLYNLTKKKMEAVRKYITALRSPTDPNESRDFNRLRRAILDEENQLTANGMLERIGYRVNKSPTIYREVVK